MPYTVDRMDVARRIMAVRKYAGLRLKKLPFTQADFADLIGTSEANVGKWEQGRSVPAPEGPISVIYSRFGIDFNYLYAGVTRDLPVHLAQDLERLESEAALEIQSRRKQNSG